MPVFALYGRKSKFSSRSESVATQIALCKEHCLRLFPDATFIIYDTDEGYSGKNTSRPGFQQLMQDIKAHKVDGVCVHRLDRISRSVADFCQLVDLFQRYNVSFISVRENVDTSTPMGRAMVYITSVFSQLERETIAERVKDNIYALAKTGRWLGGNPPTGFESVSVPSPISDGKKIVTLSPVENDLSIVRRVCELFMQLGSLSKLEAHCATHGITSRNGIAFSRPTLRALLTNPVYCTADEAAWHYFSKLPCQLCANLEDFDGVHGLMPFNRTSKDGSATTNKPIEDWIIAVGAHPGTLSGAQWVHIQRMLEQNRDLGKTYRANRTETALLSGVLRCACCGSAMRPKAYGKPYPDGSRRFSYVCSTKDITGSKLCAMKNAPGRDVDELVIKHLAHLSATGFDSSDSSAALLAQRPADDIQQQITQLQKEIAEIQSKADKMAEIIPTAPPDIHPQLFRQISLFNQQIENKKASLAELNASAMDTTGQQDLIAMVRSLFLRFEDSFSSQTYDEKRRLIRAVVDSIVWDGHSLEINVLGEKTLPK